MSSAEQPTTDLASLPVWYVPKRVAHHAQHSGYDHLFSEYGMKQARSSFFARVADMIPKSLAWRLWTLRPQPSVGPGLQAEIASFPWAAFGSGRLCHFIYGEDTFLFTPLWKRHSNFCIATLHYPPSILAQRVNPGSLSTLDGIIIVGENQREWLSRFFPSEKIHFCPHPVDTDFFSPEPNPSIEGEDASGSADDGPYRLVCVGHFFRDYRSLLEILRILRTRFNREVTLDIITPVNMSGHPISSEPGVKIHSGIEDSALRSIYRNATVATLPLTDSTANNALLEMMACGLPVVVTDIGGVRDYTEGSDVVCVAPGDNTDFAEKVNDYIAAPSLRAEAGERNRAHVVREMSLPACAKKLASIYLNVLAARKP